jgi:cell pole-organizing protein PopZ
MSGTGPKPPEGPPPAVASDQSMEDILASIRRILNEDETAIPPPAVSADPPATEPVPAAAPADTSAAGPTAESEPEPLLLTEAMMVSPPDDPAASAEAVPTPAPTPTEGPDGGLLAPAVAAAATASVGQLLRAVSTERGSMVHRSGPSIEDVVREELRPLLKDWLDQHLPAMVERLVRAEIERVVGRALS